MAILQKSFSALATWEPHPPADPRGPDRHGIGQDPARFCLNCESQIVPRTQKTAANFDPAAETGLPENGAWREGGVNPPATC